MKMNSPEPLQIKYARENSELSQYESSLATGVSLRTWQRWESGNVKMPVAAWLLYLLFTDQHPNLIAMRRTEQTDPTEKPMPTAH